MEFYLYPASNENYETGEIIKEKSTNHIYVILTPSCDFVERKNKRKAENVLVTGTSALEESSVFLKYIKNKSKENVNELQKIIKSGNERYFFLPGTPFIKDSLVDFQNTKVINYDSLEKNYKRIAKLDSPFAESFTAHFIRYFSRIGFPDIDFQYIMNKY